MQMSEGWLLFNALLIAFSLVNVVPRIRLTNRKPFNCLACMTGWIALGLAVWQGWYWADCVLILVVGVGLGGIFSGILMRWL